MNKSQFLFLLIFFLFCSESQLQAQDQKAVDILQKANIALGQLSELSYNYQYEGWGKLYGRFEGKVNISKVNGMQVLVQLNTLRKNNSIKRKEIIYTNNRDLKLLDLTDKVYKYGTSTGGGAHLMSYAWYAVFRESLMPNPFAQAMQDQSLKYEGTKEVAGISCHVISTQSPYQGDREYWFLGQKNYLIYGQRKENKTPGIEGGFLFKMSSLETNPSFSQSDFEIEVPEGVKQINEDERPIAVGKKAPPWILKNRDGGNTKSQDLKGKVVVLDFWASWCNPCWQIMPVINALKKDYPREQVEIIGVNVWENPKLDLNKYLKEKNLNDYQIMVDEEAIAAKSFKIAYLPLVVVIDQKGIIQFLYNGREADLNTKIRLAIDNALKGN